MTLGEKSSSTAALVERFKRGAIKHQAGYLSAEDDLAVEGIALIRRVIAELDALGPHGRDALIPLLDDRAPAVRAWAAAPLVKIIPERAIAVLYEVKDRSVSDANMIAARLLILHEQGQLNY